jgi:acetyltransferase-like isoleucine patch superfamily enzyme
VLARTIRHYLVNVSSWFRVNYFRFMGVRVGKGCFISIHAHLDVRRGKISIGNNVNISRGAYILSHTGYQAEKEGEATIVEDNAIIFVNAIIFPGVRIGKRSIVGAGSVVMKDVPPNVIVLGNPARVIQRLEQ